MNVTWFCIMKVNLSFWNVNVFQMSLNLVRCCLADYVVSIMFFELCLVDGVCRLVSRY
jgi:hypothetical protein